ncbi:hypothetical protein BSKO_11675 [Bryopsis sp. KO-2023]|nr:hypothetical protein BSKO_11675 [Bryopsis sp. KO-2023]
MFRTSSQIASALRILSARELGPSVPLDSLAGVCRPLSLLLSLKEFSSQKASHSYSIHAASTHFPKQYSTSTSCSHQASQEFSDSRFKSDQAQNAGSLGSWGWLQAEKGTRASQGFCSVAECVDEAVMSTDEQKDPGGKNAESGNGTVARSLALRQRVVPVYAYFVGRKIDLMGVSNDPCLRKFRRANGRDHVIIEYPGKGNQGEPAHVVVYKYGSIVLFNAPVPKGQHEELMEFSRRHISEPVPHPNHEMQSLVILPQMSNWYRQEGDRIIVKVLDTDNMRVISSVLGQSVALDQYSRQIDRALEEFNSINRELEKTGSFSVTRKELFKLVARNNMMITEAIIVLGLLDRSDTAWTNDKYYGVWSMMHSEYELNQRFQAMDKKLTLIQDSAKYFLEILQDNKSVSLEWFIIILIMAELVVGVYDLSTRH